MDSYTDQENKAEIIDDFYYNLLGWNVARENTVNLAALGIPSHEVSELDAPFFEEEVWNTIKVLPREKEPGPDGFTGSFYSVLTDHQKGSHGSNFNSLE